MRARFALSRSSRITTRCLTALTPANMRFESCRRRRSVSKSLGLTGAIVRTSVAKAEFEKRTLIAAVNRCATQNQARADFSAGSLALPLARRLFPRRCMRLLFTRRIHSADNRSVQFVFPLADLAVFVGHSNHEHGQHAFFAEVFLRNRHRQYALDPFAIGRLVAMPSQVPCEDAKLVEVE